MIQVLQIPTAEVRNVWTRVKPYLAPAITCSNGRWTPEFVLASLVLGEQSLWVIIGKDQILGALTVQVTDYPERRALAIHFLGGDGLDEWYPALSAKMVEYGRMSGCQFIECNARHGFWKTFKEDGFTKPSSFYEKPI